MVDTIKRQVRTAKRTLKQRIIALSLKQIDNEVFSWIEQNPGYRLYQIDNATLKSHHNWGAKYIVERLIEQGRVYVKETPRGNQIIKSYWSR